MVIEPKAFNVPDDFARVAIWRLDDGDNLFHPVLGSDDLPISERDALIRATFTTPGGDVIHGYVVGISRVFSIGLFAGDKVFLVNSNLPKRARSELSQLIALNAQVRAKLPEELFPLRYQTTINRTGFRDFSGSFEIDLTS